MVADVLEELRQQGTILDYQKTEWCSPDDKRGIDFFAYIHNEVGKKTEVLLQVKSSRRALVEFYKKRDGAKGAVRRLYQPPAVINTQKPILPQVMRAIKRFYKHRPKVHHDLPREEVKRKEKRFRL